MNPPYPSLLLTGSPSTEECCDLEESPGSLQPSETSSNGAAEDSGSLWGSLGPNTVSVGSGSCQGPGSMGSAVSYQDSIRRCSQRKKSDVLLLGCASLLASVAFGQDLLQLGKLQVRNPAECFLVEKIVWRLNLSFCVTSAGSPGRAGPPRRAAEKEGGPFPACGTLSP